VKRAVMACSALLLTACSGSQDGEFSRVSLPGFSIELPRGKVKRTSEAPSAGKHELDLPEPSFMDSLSQKAVSKPRMSVEWMAQSYSRQEWDQQMLPIFTQSLAREVPGSRILRQEALSDDRWLHVIGAPGSPVAFGVVRCDAKFSVLVVHGRYRDLERETDEFRRIIRSVTCNVTDENRAHVVAAVRLPEKFGVLQEDQGQVYRSLDGEVMNLNFTSGDIQKDPRTYRNVITSLITTALGIQFEDSQLVSLDTAVQSPGGKTSLLRADLPDTPERLYVGSLYCPDRNLTLLSIWAAQARDDALARERQSQVGCPHEESTSHRRFAEILDEACRAGDHVACDLQKEPENR